MLEVRTHQLMFSCMPVVGAQVVGGLLVHWKRSGTICSFNKSELAALENTKIKHFEF